MTEVNLARKWWPQYFKSDFMSEDSIVEDMVTKIRNNTKSSKWWNTVTNDELIAFNKRYPKALINHYQIDNSNNHHFNNLNEDIHDVQLRIFFRVWKRLRQSNDIRRID